MGPATAHADTGGAGPVDHAAVAACAAVPGVSRGVDAPAVAAGPINGAGGASGAARAADRSAPADPSRAAAAAPEAGGTGRVGAAGLARPTAGGADPTGADLVRPGAGCPYGHTRPACPVAAAVAAPGACLPTPATDGGGGACLAGGASTASRTPGAGVDLPGATIRRCAALLTCTGGVLALRRAARAIAVLADLTGWTADALANCVPIRTAADVVSTAEAIAAVIGSTANLSPTAVGDAAAVLALGGAGRRRALGLPLLVLTLAVLLVGA